MLILPDGFRVAYWRVAVDDQGRLATDWRLEEIDDVLRLFGVSAEETAHPRTDALYLHQGQFAHDVLLIAIEATFSALRDEAVLTMVNLCHGLWLLLGETARETLLTHNVEAAIVKAWRLASEKYSKEHSDPHGRSPSP